MFKNITENKILFFILKAFGLYLFWYILYDLLLHPNNKFDSIVSDNLVYFSSHILQIIGYKTIDVNTMNHNDIRVIGIDGTHGLWLGDPCNGISLFALFTGFVIAYPGKLSNKFWFIPIGIVAIHFINIIRIIALCLIVLYAPSTLQFNHTYTFTLLVYAFVFWLWLLWANRFSKQKTIVKSI